LDGGEGSVDKFGVAGVGAVPVARRAVCASIFSECAMHVSSFWR
jgi:hypothetical protein